MEYKAIRVARVMLGGTTPDGGHLVLVLEDNNGATRAISLSPDVAIETIQVIAAGLRGDKEMIQFPPRPLAGSAVRR